MHFIPPAKHFHYMKFSQTSDLFATVNALISERKKLSAQVKYLHAKFGKENSYRNALQVQKDYLICLVGKFKQR